MNQERERLIIVGNGPKECWENALAALTGTYELSLVSGDYPTWQSAYVEKHRVADTSEYGSLFEAVSDLRGEVAFAGLLAIDGPSVPPLAAVADKLRMRFIAPGTARLCASPATLEAALADAGVAATQGTAGLLVHSVVIDTAVTPVCVARLETTTEDRQAARLIANWRSQQWGDQLITVVTGTHQIAGADWGVTATSLRITNGELQVTGLAPWLGEAITGTPAGVGLAKIAAAIAFEREPDPTMLDQLAGGSATT